MQRVEEDARAAAIDQLAQLFQRPDQLEKLPALRKRAERKKAAVEALLRTGVQAQLDSVRAAIAQLAQASDDIQAIEKSMDSMMERLGPMTVLRERMTALREANARHAQYAAAMENLSLIFHLPQSLDACGNAIRDGDLLLAHKHIMELEQARDDLLLEVHRINEGDVEFDKNLLKNYFAEVERLVEELAKQMWYVIGRSLEAVRSHDASAGPHLLVSALRIVEREERIDKYYEEHATQQRGFMPPGRPRKWKVTALEVLRKQAVQRVEGNQLEERALNKHWLARHLEVIRHVVTEDLLVARTLAAPCFPPHWQIYDHFVDAYHTAVRKRVRDVSKEQLEKNELVQLLSWVAAYTGDKMLGNPRLRIEAVAMVRDRPLLTKDTTKMLHEKFMAITRTDMRDWLRRALETEKDDWMKRVPPDEDTTRGWLYTQLPSILFSMQDDTVTLAKEMSVELIPLVLAVSIEQFLEFAVQYKDATAEFKQRHFEDRAKYATVFTKTMIAVANNVHMCMESTERLMRQVRMTMESGTDAETPAAPPPSAPLRQTAGQKTSDLPSPGAAGQAAVTRASLLENIDLLNTRWNNVIKAALSALMEEVTMDIQQHLQQLFTKTWLTERIALETIVATLQDYRTDHRHLRPHILAALILQLQYKIVGEYICAIQQRRLTFGVVTERVTAARRLRDDATKLSRLFGELSSGTETEVILLSDVLTTMADVLELDDRSMLPLETTTLLRRFPDMSVELVSSLLLMREDVGRQDAKSLAEDAHKHTRFHPSDAAHRRFFEAVAEAGYDDTGGKLRTVALNAYLYAQAYRNAAKK